MSCGDAIGAAIVATLEAMTSWWYVGVFVGSFVLSMHSQRKAQREAK